MPKANTSPDAILEAIKKIDVLSELLDEKNQHNLKMSVDLISAGFQQIGP